MKQPCTVTIKEFLENLNELLPESPEPLYRVKDVGYNEPTGQRILQMIAYHDISQGYGLHTRVIDKNFVDTLGITRNYQDGTYNRVLDKTDFITRYSATPDDETQNTPLDVFNMLTKTGVNINLAMKASYSINILTKDMLQISETTVGNKDITYSVKNLHTLIETYGQKTFADTNSEKLVNLLRIDLEQVTADEVTLFATMPDSWIENFTPTLPYPKELISYTVPDSSHDASGKRKTISL